MYKLSRCFRKVSGNKWFLLKNTDECKNSKYPIFCKFRSNLSRLIRIWFLLREKPWNVRSLLLQEELSVFVSIVLARLGFIEHPEYDGYPCVEDQNNPHYNHTREIIVSYLVWRNKKQSKFSALN